MHGLNIKLWFLEQVSIPCRPQKTFTLFVLDVPDDLPVEDVRHSLYRFNSVVEVVRLVVHFANEKPPAEGKFWMNEIHCGQSARVLILMLKGTPPPKPQLPKVAKEDELPNNKDAPPAPIRITLASLDEYNILLQNGLDFYGATFFPTESNLPQYTAAKIATKRGR